MLAVAAAIDSVLVHTNALMLAILPLASQYADRLSLDVQLPIVPDHVRRFDPAPLDEGGTVVLTSGTHISITRGMLSQFCTPWYLRQMAKPSTVPANTMTLTKDRAVTVVRNALLALGCDTDLLYTELPPTVTGMKAHRGRADPFLRVEWVHPSVEGSLTVSAAVSSGGSGRLEYLLMPGAAAVGHVRRPTFLTDAPVPGGTRVRFTEAELTTYRAAVLTHADVMSQRLELPLRHPITDADVQECYGFWESGRMWGVLVLTNGYSFVSHGLSVSGVFAPDAFFRNVNVRLSQVVGTWKLSRSAALGRARETIRRLGYPAEWLPWQLKPKVATPSHVAAGRVPRYEFSWPADNRRDAHFRMRVEVDARDGQTKACYFESDKIDVNSPQPRGVTTGQQ